MELHTFSFNNQLIPTQHLAALPQSAKMAPKEPYKVHSLSKHIEETTKGLNANTRNKKASAKASIKKPATASATSFFLNNNSESDSSSSSSDDSDSDGPGFVKALEKPKATKRRSKDDEIADSDVERTSAANKSKPAKKAAAPTKAKAASSSDDTSSDADSESSDEEVSTKGAALKSKASTSASSPTSSSGSDSDSGSSSSSEAPSSDDDAESESESEAAPTKPVAGVKGPAGKPARAKEPESGIDDSSPEDSESESEGSSQPAAKPTSKPVVNGAKVTWKAANATESDDESDDSNERESNNGAQSGTESSDDEEADESMQIAERAQASQVALPQLLPPDFELRKSDQQSNGQDVARVCSEANLEGKQLWYFTLPANVPVSVAENLEFPMDASQQGGSILSHNGEDYGISFDSTPPVKSIQILIPSADGSTYQPCKDAFQKAN